MNDNKTDSNKINFEKFKVPDAEFRSAPFWGWNDKLDKADIIRQIDDMHRAGIGGFFVHSRDGLETEYLSGEWFDILRTAVKAAKKRGMHVWLYDEDRWPSGTCGGTVTASGEHALKGLTLEVCRELQKDVKDDNSVLALYAARIDDKNNTETITALRMLDAKSPMIGNGETALIARLETSRGSEWFNGSPPPDNLSSDAVECFISKTHEVYKKELGAEFKKTIRGIFTDEPSLADRHAAFPENRGWIPWTSGFDKYFAEKRGYDIMPCVPYIYFRGRNDEDRKARHDYWRTVAERFSENYSGRISNRCRENNIKFTGHFLQEDRMGLSCRVNGAVMPHYVYQDIPGIDMLTENTREYITVKQCSSVAAQTGKPRVLSEMYGCTGWDFSFEGQKWMGDWQYALGVNFRCQHIALYSLRGCRKRDCPPSINHSSCRFSHYRAVEDYFARLSYILSRGDAVRKVLVISPMSTVWSRLGCDPHGNPKRSKERDVPPLDELGYKFNSLIESLCRNHFDCDIGDETVIRELAEVSGDKPEFIVGECRYCAVIVPYCETLLPETANLLNKFTDKGGKVIAVPPLADKCAGEPSDSAKAFFGKNDRVILCDEKDNKRIFEYLPRVISICDTDGREQTDILCMLRRTERGLVLFCANNSREKKVYARIRVSLDEYIKNHHDDRGNIYIYRLDPMNGDIKKYRSEHKNGSVSLEYGFMQCGSAVFYITHDDLNCPSDSAPLLFSGTEYATEYTDIKTTFRGAEAVDPNVLTLDRCRYSLDGKSLGEAEVWEAQNDIRDRLGMRRVDMCGGVQRYRFVGTPHPNDGHKVELSFDFKSLCGIDSPTLVIERPELFEIFADGQKVKNTPSGYFVDPSFKTLPLPKLNAGKHTVTLRCEYKNDFELENCYIIGSFAVSRDRLITVQTPIALGDITSMGLFHYAGEVEYKFEFDINNNIDPQNENDIYLSIEKFVGICALASINGNIVEVPWIGMGPIRINDFVRHGKNEVLVRVAVGLRNMLGPLHLSKKPSAVKDSAFCPKGDNRTRDYITEPFGLYAPIKINCAKHRL